ncbi:MAG: hypothetical protein J6R47_02350, partial [Acholeplasmatales bacterium]|nr:hypothetical protein [Acholeplasmatales bacterium]
EINEQLESQETDTRCICKYDKDLGTFRLRFDSGESRHHFSIKFIYGYDAEYDESEARYNDPEYIHYKAEFLKLFNQPVNKDNIDHLHHLSDIDMEYLQFNNVWNRDSFYCHSSFSDSPKQIIGINHDFWPTPSVFYAPSDNSNDFNVYFTTNTVNRILPRNGVMLIQLSYIFNYQNSMLSYV